MGDVYINNKFEYIKCYLNYIDEETPIVLFYEVNLENERYATRMTEVSVPIINEIHKEEEFLLKLF